MARTRPFAISLFACPALVLTGAVVQHAAPLPFAEPAPLDRPAPAAAAHPRALELLDQALARLAPERVPWLETSVWQRTACGDLLYEAEGSFLSAPGNRRRLRLRVTAGRARAEVTAVSDGRRLRVTSRVGGAAPAVSDTALPAAPADCEALLRQRAGGAAALLAAIRRKLQRPRAEVVLWGGRDVVRITGEWAGGTRPASAPEGVPPAATPRRCRVYLDAATLWPRRVEWWGADGRGRDVPVSEVEFRGPVLGRPLPPERCAREFTLPPA